MGIFSGKKKTYRDFSYARLIEDDYLPNVISQAVMTYVLDQTNTQGLADLMLEYGWQNNSLKWNAAYRYAKKPGKYYYGVPASSAVAETDFTGSETLEDVLEDLTGQKNLTYVYSKFGVMNFRHIMWQLLVSNYSYNPTNNTLDTLSASLGTTAYLHDAKNFLSLDTQEKADPFMLQHWGYSPTSGQTNTRTKDLSRPDTPNGTSSTNNYTRVEYAFSFSGITRTKTDTITTTTTVVKTPNEEGGYDEQTTTDSDTSSNTDTDWGGWTLPPNMVSSAEVSTGSNDTEENDPPQTTTTTDPETGVITEVTVNVKRNIRVTGLVLNGIAYFNMDFSPYDIDWSDAGVDTGTVLDDEDKGNYDPTATLKPSGEVENESADLFMVCFTYVSTDGSTHTLYFTYQYGSGSYPALDGITGTEIADFGEHFPRIYVRIDGNRLDEPRYVDTLPYNTSRKLSKRLGIDWLTMVDTLHESIGSLDKVRDIMMIQCVPANTTDPLEQEYLFKYFKTFYNSRRPIAAGEVPEDDPWNRHRGATMRSYDNTSELFLSMNNVGFQTLTGSIGEEGKTASGFRDGYHYYQMQVSGTQYEELRVYNLVHTVTVGGNRQHKNELDENLMVPLDYAFRKQFSSHKRETLYARAAHILITTEYSVKSKWYQTGVFKAVIVVVSVVLSWWTAGASMTFAAALTAVATAIGSMVAFSLLNKYVFSKLGANFAIIATVIAIAVALYAGYVGFTGESGAFSLTATDLMQASNIAFKAANGAEQGAIAKEQQKLATLQGEINEKTEQLKQAEEELNSGTNSINDSVFSTLGYFRVGETPDGFFARTLNTNVGVIALDLPDVYMAQALSLPTPVAIFAQIQQTITKPFELDSDLYDL